MDQINSDLTQHDLFWSEPETIRPRQSTDERLKDLSRPDMVRVAPERYAWIPATHITEPPKFCLGRWIKKGPEFRLIPAGGKWIRMTAEVAAELGWRGVDRKSSYDTLKRLAAAGFIDFVHVAPGTHLLDLESWFRHLGDCMSNPDKWDKGSEDLETYQESNGLGGWKTKI